VTTPTLKKSPKNQIIPGVKNTKTPHRIKVVTPVSALPHVDPGVSESVAIPVIHVIVPSTARIAGIDYIVAPSIPISTNDYIANVLKGIIKK